MLQIHFADAHVIVLDKPAGLLAVPGRGEAGRDCLWQRLLAEWPDARVVHRLDMATSGLMVFARGAAAQRALSMAFERREVHKGYTAIASGVIDGLSGSITLPLAADWPNRPRQKVDAVNGKPSVTRWQRLESDATAGRTRLALQPLTGRSHQLRVHLMAIGHPILGDTLYAPPEPRQQANRLLLHASRLAFEHPLQAQTLAFDSPAPF